VDLLTGIFFTLLAAAFLSYLVTLRGKVLYWRIILLYLSLIAVTSLAANYLRFFSQVKNNLFLFHVYTPAEYVVLCWLYYSIIVNRVVKNMIFFSIPGFIALSVFFSIFIQRFDANDSFVIIIESILIISWSLFFLREVLLLQQETSVIKYPLFWVSIGMLFYFVGDLFVEGLLDYLIKHSPDLAKRVYSFGYIFKYLLFILLTTGAWCNYSPKRR